MCDTHSVIIIFKNFSRLFIVADLFYAFPFQVPLFHLLQKAIVRSPPSSKHCASVIFPYKHYRKPQNLLPLTWKMLCSCWINLVSLCILLSRKRIQCNTIKKRTHTCCSGNARKQHQNNAGTSHQHVESQP